MKEFTITPSNWLYNAGIVGLLRVLSYADHQQVEKTLKESSYILKINEDDLRKIGDTFVNYLKSYIKKLDEARKKEKATSIQSFLFHKTGIFPNLQQMKDIKNDADVKSWLNDQIISRVFAHSFKEGPSCRFCGLPAGTKFRIPYDVFDMVWGELEGTTYDKNPNLFFFNQNDLLICPLCRFVFVMSGLVVSKRSNQKVFINLPNIKALFFLNELYSDDTISVLEAASSMEFLKSAWLLQNIEIIMLQNDVINHLPIDAVTSKLIIQPRIRIALKKAGKDVLRHFTVGNPSDLFDLCFKKIREFIKGVAKSETNRWYEIIFLGFIKSISIKGGIHMDKANDCLQSFQKIGWYLGNEAKLDDKIKRHGYRLLSLIRLNQRQEFLFEIMRLHMTKEKECPKDIVHLGDPGIPVEEFQAKAYSLLCGYLTNSSKEDLS